MSNRPPSVRWETSGLFCGHPSPVKRQHLVIGGAETPYFIDTARRSAHRPMGERHGLYGSGMSDGGCAKLLDAGPYIAPLKRKAERLATE